MTSRFVTVKYKKKKNVAASDFLSFPGMMFQASHVDFMFHNYEIILFGIYLALVFNDIIASMNIPCDFFPFHLVPS